MTFTRSTPLLLALLATLLWTLLPGGSAASQETTVVFLVRHAERGDDGAMTGSEDPHLSPAGAQRAQELALLLRDAGITHLHSTDYRRTRATAAPLARELGIEVALYEGGHLQAFARQLSAVPGRHLVVGHSDTTPALVTALGGDPHGEIEPLEYDRLYMVRAGPENTETVLFRYGDPYSTPY
jgi:phosphohistidine phosphatase SixA